MKLKNICKNEGLILPDYNNLNIVDLVKFLYSNYGISTEKNKNIEILKQIIPIKKHMILILVDGMGSNLINLLDNKSILKTNKVKDMITVSPSSTGCVLTSLATATYPEEHGIIGWYNYSRDYDIDYYSLLFTSRKDNKDLRTLGIDSKKIYKIDSKLNYLNVKTNVLYPNYIYDSVYSKYVANNSIRKSYMDLNDAFNKIEKILENNEETFTYLYIPYIDDLEHDNGYDNKEVLDKMNEIELQIEKLKDKKDVTIVITADHGQTNIDINKDILMDFDKYDKYFYARPGIDFGMATYYINKGMEKEFVKEFNSDYKDKMFLFETNDFLMNKVFGPTGNGDYLKSNLGEYISLCKKDSQFINSEEIELYYKKTKGNHSGLSTDEMIIPLIIISQ